MATKILIIEDDIVLNEMYSMKFEREWFEVVSSFDWQEWLDKIDEFHPDIVLLDIMMPWMNGYETLKLLKEQNKTWFKIIMFSNLNSKEDIAKALAMWADDYLLKASTTPKEAVEKVNILLGITKED